MTGAVIAVAVGWTSIVVAIHAPLDRYVSPRALRIVGSVALTLLGLGILGVPHAARIALWWLVIALAGIACHGWYQARRATNPVRPPTSPPPPGHR